MTYLVSETDLENVRLNEKNPVLSVLQNVALILATPKGSVPMYRDFGLDRSFLDMPLPNAEIRMIAPVKEAVELWEPRAKVVGVSFSRKESCQGKLRVSVSIEIKEGAQS